MVLLDTESLLTWTFISQCLSMQFKESLEAQRVNLGKNNCDDKLNLLCSWLWIASEHALELNETQDTIFKNVLNVLRSPHCLSVAFTLQRNTFAVASLQIS